MTQEDKKTLSRSTDSEPDAAGGRLSSWVMARPRTSLLIASGLALLVAAAIAIPLVASKSSEISDLDSRLASTSAQLEDAESERDAAQDVADDITSRRETIIAGAKTQAKSLVGGAQEKVKDLKQQADEAGQDLASTQSKLDSVNASLETAQQTKDMSTFSDGTWSVGDEVLAGTYRSTAGGSCYWEILNSPSGGGINNIVDNGFGPGATITVSAGQWVHVDDCGSWSPGP